MKTSAGSHAWGTFQAWAFGVHERTFNPGDGLTVTNTRSFAHITKGAMNTPPLGGGKCRQRGRPGTEGKPREVPEAPERAAMRAKGYNGGLVNNLLDTRG